MEQRDSAEAAVVADCAQCRGEIYVGDDVRRIDDSGDYVHAGWGRDCAEKYAMERVYDAEGVINDKGAIY
ncbi:hypothetical protein BBD42_15405 [Paenibacillus sp. BIHB 4019]|uniref:Uncharacterized protein n=1 Tax=Paenibacillus sp. BIHB 4019 TaxID=1870819 RepID=A0A1B2DJ09_9BACL|nr:hypothetical protein [Paenibacillus sp. BIHB 4019]ANY67698.1 hypothetical protein BBD42_15405 [Paenibacillus sp. BIHB 4019]